MLHSKLFLFIILILLILQSSLLFGQQSIKQEFRSIQVSVNDNKIMNPFSGGIDMSRPTFADIDGDGDKDLFVGEQYGGIHFYQNNGFENEKFTLITTFFSSIDVGWNSHPAFADIDHDSDLDLFIGEQDGNLNYYENVGSSQSNNFHLQTKNYQKIQRKLMSTPTLTDIDGDFDFDMFIGGQDGKIWFYRNDGSMISPNFTLQDTFFNVIDVGNFSIPKFCDIDNDGDQDLFIGCESGEIYFYRNDGNSKEHDLKLVTKNYAVKESWMNPLVTNFSAPAFVDIDYDNDFDLLVGEFFPGHLKLCRNTGTSQIPEHALEKEQFLTLDFGRYSVPHFVDIDGDQDKDMFVGGHSGQVWYFENIGHWGKPKFTLINDNIIDVGKMSAPTSADIDGDGDFDLFVGGSDGYIQFIKNVGSPNNPIYSLIDQKFSDINVGHRCKPLFRDIDNDKDLDLFIGEEEGNINYYENKGNVDESKFFLSDENYYGITTELEGQSGISAPEILDWDRDGDLDLFLGSLFRGVLYYENIGSPTNPDFSISGQSFGCFPRDIALHPNFCDIDTDGDIDLFLGNGNGGLLFFRNITNPDPKLELEKKFITLGDVKSDTLNDTLYTVVEIKNNGEGILSGIVETPTRWIFSTINLFQVKSQSIKTIAFCIISDSLSIGDNIGQFIIDTNGGTTVGQVQIKILENNPPNNFKLIYPPQDYNHTQDSLITFLWESSTDIDKDSLTYQLKFESQSKLDTTLVLSDTNYTANILYMPFPREKDIIWEVFATDGMDNTKAINSPFNFQITNGLGIEIGSTTSSKFTLNQNYPNPFNPSTNIKYELAEDLFVNITVYDINGNVKKILVDEFKNKGKYNITWNASDLSSGIYFYKIEAGSFINMKKCILLK